MKRILKYSILVLLIILFLSNFIPNFLTVCVHVKNKSWSVWTAPDYVPAVNEAENAESLWTTHTLRLGDRVVFDGFYDVAFVVKDIDLFSITIKSETDLTQVRNNGTYGIYYGRKTFKIPRNKNVELSTPTMDSGQILTIDFAGFE